MITSCDNGIPAFSGDIFLTNGASAAIQSVLTAVFASDHDALMIPIPQASQACVARYLGFGWLILGGVERSASSLTYLRIKFIFKI